MFYYYVTEIGGNVVVGLLWYDDDKKTDFNQKVDRAISHFKQKYGKTPELCFVNPKLVATENLIVDGVEVRSNLQVLPNHFWLGFRTATDR
jgi:hypothetical protein